MEFLTVIKSTVCLYSAQKTEVLYSMKVQLEINSPEGTEWYTGLYLEYPKH